MTNEQEQHLDEVLENVDTSPETLKGLNIKELVQKAHGVYVAVRPALTTLGFLVTIFAPKLKDAANKLIATLDALFEVLPAVVEEL